MAVKKKAQCARGTLTERQAWKVVALIYSWRSGMCSTTERLREARLISPATALQMHRRIGSYRRQHSIESSYFWPIQSTVHDTARVAFADAAATRAG